MKILLVQIINPERPQDAIIPTGLGYIAAYLRQELGDAVVRIEQHNLKQVTRTFQPDIIGISSVTQNYGRAKEYSAWCKQFNGTIPIVIGGHHISALPGTISADMDIAVIGEGEISMLEICKAIQQSGLESGTWKKINGIAYKNETGTLCRTDPQSSIEDLDTLPLPARDLMHLVPGEAVGIVTSRGCPYNCVFCASKTFWRSVRFHSAEYVVREIEAVLKEYRPTHIYLWDDLFTAHLKRFRQIVSKIKEKGIQKQVKFSMHCRANLVNQELVELMTEMNVFEVAMGLESFSPSVLSYLKDHVTVEDNQRAIELLNQANIKILGYFIIGSPHETYEDIQQTLDAFKNANLHRAQAYILAPLPGTKVWDHAYQKGLVSEDMDWDRLYIDAPADRNNGIVLSETLEDKDIRALLGSFQSVRRRKEIWLRVNKGLYYLRLVFTEPRTVQSLVKRHWRLRAYQVREHLNNIFARN